MGLYKKCNPKAYMEVAVSEFAEKIYSDKFLCSNDSKHCRHLGDIILVPEGTVFEGTENETALYKICQECLKPE